MGKGTVGNFKQKNKKFKGESKGRAKRLQKGVSVDFRFKEKPFSLSSQKVTKIKAVSMNSHNFKQLDKKARKNQTIQAVKSKRQKTEGFMSSVISQSSLSSSRHCSLQDRSRRSQERFCDLQRSQNHPVGSLQCSSPARCDQVD